MITEKIQFFAEMQKQGLALTFDDVRLRTDRSSVTPTNVKITSRFSTHVELKVPIVSAAMDTVTTANMAIAVAKIGGIGVIHAGLTPEEQRIEVRRVKLHLNGFVEKPVTAKDDQTMAEVIAMCEEKQFDFKTFPVVNSKGKFVGLLTQNDFDFSDKSTLVRNAMTPSKDATTAPASISVESAYDLMREHKKKTLPIIEKDGTLGGMYVFSDVKRIAEGNPDQYNLDENGSLRVAAAVPTDDGALERVRLMHKYVDVVVIDTAQGDSDFAVDTLKKLKAEFPDIDVVVGNISEGASARALAEAGADGIKVGQGPGSICTTRTETGIGCPQVTAVYECARAVREAGYNIPVCADGGIKDPGDISIAIAAGADSVMMGGRLAGTKEAPGQILELEDGSRVKLYRGMGSPSALRDSAASRKRYGITEGVVGKPLAEGVESYVPYKGEVFNVLDRFMKALRKSMSYVGAPDIAAHQKNTMFWRITGSGLRESHPHDVRVVSRT
ncbi:MAG: dehydrogenase [Candidatus Saccharibacteria bacterium]|nr:dehydrogenase [Candidatus Saccharibacteria bacterium]